MGRNAVPKCRGHRVVSHPELHELAIAHLDCDAFYAAIEKRDDPSVRDKAVIVGGGKRGVVSTCCYIARIDGVRSAMPMFKARTLCPQAVIIKPNMAKYVAEGRRVRALMRGPHPSRRAAVAGRGLSRSFGHRPLAWPEPREIHGDARENGSRTRSVSPFPSGCPATSSSPSSPRRSTSRAVSRSSARAKRSRSCATSPSA